MIKPGFYIKLIVFALIFCLFGCKHKQQQVSAIERPKGKTPPVKTAPGNKPAGSHAGEGALQQKLGLNSKQIQSSRFYSFIDDWYGVPYKYGGCQKAGVDCSCFTNLLYEKVYDKRIARSAADMFKSCDEISLQDAKTGDLVFFKIGGNTISHVGVYIKNKLFVHASNSKGVIINSLDEAYYKKYFFCAGKLKSV